MTYQLWASLTLELLGKAALARQHPCLVVDPQHAPSMFVAAGFNITTDVKTITAKTLFERLTHLMPRFDKLVQKFCMEIAERRNAELHSADLPFKTMRLDAWEERYWHACDTILRHMETSLEDWIGAADAAAPRQLLAEAASALTAAVKLRVESHRAAFQELKKAEREKLHADAELREPDKQTALFPERYDEIWTESCPACACRAFVTGEQTGEDITKEADEYGIWKPSIGNSSVRISSAPLAISRSPAVTNWMLLGSTTSTPISGSGRWNMNRTMETIDRTDGMPLNRLHQL